jgi:hypothetical protein
VISAFILGFIVAGLLFYRQKRKKMAGAFAEPERATGQMYNKPELHGNSSVRPQAQRYHERPDSRRSELPAREPVGSELEGKRRVQRIDR